MKHSAEGKDYVTQIFMPKCKLVCSANEMDKENGLMISQAASQGNHVIQMAFNGALWKDMCLEQSPDWFFYFENHT